MGGESIKPIRKRIHVYFLMTAYGVSEQWVYRGTGFAKNRYLYFKNGILTSMQE